MDKWFLITHTHGIDVFPARDHSAAWSTACRRHGIENVIEKREATPEEIIRAAAQPPPEKRAV